MTAIRNPAVSATIPTSLLKPDAESVPMVMIRINIIPERSSGKASEKENIIGIIPEKNSPERTKSISELIREYINGDVMRHAVVRRERIARSPSGFFQKRNRAAQRYLPTVIAAQKRERISRERKSANPGNMSFKYFGIQLLGIVSAPI